MGRNILRREASVAQAEDGYAVISIFDELCNIAGEGAWWILPDVHPSHIFSVGRHQPRVIHQEVGVHKIQINIVNQRSRVHEMRMVFLQEKYFN